MTRAAASVLPRPSPVVPPGAAADVVLVSVTWNSARIIAQFLAALPAALDGVASARVVVVDNASSDGTPDRIRASADWVEVLESGGNLGYAGGLNVALRHVVARRAVLVLNPDAVPQPSCVQRLLDAADRYDAGIVVPRVLDVHGRLKFSLRREPTLLRAVGEALLGGHRSARHPRLGDMIRDPGYYTDGAAADWATGAAMLLRSDVVAEVGLWSEEFFLYSEETDYALRARDAGYSLRFAGDAVVVHPGGEMSRSPWLWSILTRNRVRLYRRRHGTLAAALYWCVVLLNEGLRGLLGRPTHRAAFRALLTGRLPARD